MAKVVELGSKTQEKVEPTQEKKALSMGEVMEINKQLQNQINLLAGELRKRAGAEFFKRLDYFMVILGLQTKSGDSMFPNDFITDIKREVMDSLMGQEEETKEEK